MKLDLTFVENTVTEVLLSPQCHEDQQQINRIRHIMMPKAPQAHSGPMVVPVDFNELENMNEMFAGNEGNDSCGASPGDNNSGAESGDEAEKKTGILSNAVNENG